MLASPTIQFISLVYPATVIAEVNIAGTIVVTPNSPTCTVTSSSKNISVPMGTVSRNAITGPGSVSPTAQSFGIDLTCSGGRSGGLANNIYVTLTDQANPSNTSDILPLTNQPGSATGVGIQVFYNGSAVHFGQASDTFGNPGQWSAGSTLPGAAGNGSYHIPLTAQYVKTGNITAGSAAAYATFTMSYH